MGTRVSQSCFDNGFLLTVRNTGDTRFDVNNNMQEHYHFQLDMPRNVTCSQCILQWVYTTGKNGICWHSIVDSKTFQSFRLSGKKGGRRRVRTDGVRSGADDRKDEIFQKLEKNYDFSRNSNKVPVDYQSKV